MTQETCCAFCAKLPVAHAGKSGQFSRCPACHGALLAARGGGATYRLVEAEPGTPEQHGFLRNHWIVAALVGAAAAMLLGWILVRPLWNARTQPIATAAAPSAKKVEPPTNTVPRPHGEELQTAAVPEAKPVPDVKAVAKTTQTPPAARLAAHAAPMAESSVSWAKAEPWQRCTAKAAAFPWSAQSKVDLFRPTADWASSVALSEKEMMAALKQVPELSFTGKIKDADLKEVTRSHEKYLAELKRLQPDLTGLPFIEKDCQLSSTAAHDFGANARLMRQVFTGFLREADKYYPVSGELQYESAKVDETYGAGSLGTKDNTLTPRAQVLKQRLAMRNVQTDQLNQNTALVPVLNQLMMAEDTAFRQVLIAFLASVTDAKSTAALAKRALFDQNPMNRQGAITALKNRRPQDYASILIEGLRYPSPTVAHHAAHALAILQPKEVAGRLVDMLDEPDPNLPFQDNGKFKVREVVRINHHRNCVLCHAPVVAGDGSDDRNVVVSGPSPDQPLPGPFNVTYYIPKSGGPLIRADVTYLRQDFSVYLDVDNPGKWSAKQRFDFLVRVREVTKEEASKLTAASQQRALSQVSPYKSAILFALQELTGIHAGRSAAAWRGRLGLDGKKG